MSSLVEVGEASPFVLPFHLKALLETYKEGGCGHGDATWHHTTNYSFLVAADGGRVFAIPKRESWSSPCAPPIDLTALPCIPDLYHAVVIPVLPAALRSFFTLGLTQLSVNHFQAYVHGGAAAPPTPASVEVGPLKEADLPLVVSLWPYTRESPKTLERFAAALRRGFPSACARDPDGAPIAWARKIEDGTISALHTLEAHRGKGLARAVVKHLVDHAQSTGASTPYCYISRSNTASIGLMTSLGFEPSGGVSWVVPVKAAGDALRVVALEAGSPVDTPATWEAVVGLINRTYRQDDEFFVDQVRTSVEVVQGMAAEGMFWAAYTPVGDGEQLVATAYVKVADGKAACGPMASTGTGFEECRPAGLALGSVVAGRVAHLGMIGVDPAFKRRGLGTAMLSLAEAEAIYFGCETAQVHVVSVKPWLEAFYAGKGYKRVGEEAWPTPHELNPGVACFFHVMHKSLVG